MEEFKIVLSEPRYLVENIAMAKELVTEVRFKLTTDKLEFVAMDPANVAMVMYELMSSCCVEWKVENETSFAVNIGNLYSVLKDAKKNDIVVITKDENKLKILFRGGCDRTFVVPTIESDEKEQKVPELGYKTEIEIKPNVLKEEIEGGGKVADSVIFEMKNKNFFVSALGDMNTYEVKNNEDVVLRNEEDMKSKYSIEYLKKMFPKKKSIYDNMRLKFGDNYPLTLEYSSVDKTRIRFILAPRVENQ